ncbi:MAG: clostripain-related cysteine peptidase, partial [Nitrososphaerales archaeon]
MTNPFDPFDRKLATGSVGAGDAQPSRLDVDDSNWSLTSEDPNRTVRAGRRRRTEGDPSQRERAEAPERHDTPPSSSGGGGGGFGGGGFGGGGGGGFNIPGGTRGVAGGGMGLLVLCVLVAFFLLTRGGGNTSTSDQQGGPFGQAPQPTENAGGLLGQLAATAAPAPTLAPIATARPRATAAPAAQATSAATSAQGGAAPGITPGQTWTVMLYQDADDKILEEDIFLDFNEAERVGSTDRVKVVAQMDRYKGGFNGDGNWTSTRRYLLSRDDNFNRINSQLISEGEVNMSSGDTLADFVTWAAQTYPADKYVLILSDHGMGWPGGWSDPDPGRQGQQVDRRIPLESAIGDNLFLNELDAALAKAQQQTGISQFELIGLDACLMGHVEVMDMLAPYARYAVFSQETEPSLGWAYTAFLGNLAQNPDT